MSERTQDAYRANWLANAQATPQQIVDALADALIDCLAQLELTGEPFLDEAVHAGRAALKLAGRLP